MKKAINSIITRSMAAATALVGRVEPLGLPLEDRRVSKRIKYSFMDMMWKPKATKRYVNGKLNARKKDKFRHASKYAKSVVQLREQAVGKHWAKA